MTETATEHPLQKPLWDLEWSIHFAIEWAERCDDQAAEAWDRVAQLRGQLDELLASVDNTSANRSDNPC